MTDNNLNSTDLDQLPELTKKDEKEIQKMINRLDEENIDDAEPVNSDSCLARLPAKKFLRRYSQTMSSCPKLFSSSRSRYSPISLKNFTGPYGPTTFVS